MMIKRMIEFFIFIAAHSGIIASSSGQKIDLNPLYMQLVYNETQKIFTGLSNLLKDEKNITKQKIELLLQYDTTKMGYVIPWPIEDCFKNSELDWVNFNTRGLKWSQIQELIRLRVRFNTDFSTLQKGMKSLTWIRSLALYVTTLVPDVPGELHINLNSNNHSDKFNKNYPEYMKFGRFHGKY
jgi:hypothetical protein